MKNKINISNFLKKVEKITAQKELDLSSDEDLSIGIMNLISIEEHLFFTSQKTKNEIYLDLINEIRSIRTELMKKIITDYEGEIWCVSKHLLAASMRIMEVGTKELKKGNKKQAWDLFDKSFKLYSLFWGLNLDLITTKEVNKNNYQKISFINETSNKQKTASVFSKLSVLMQKAVNCCKE